MNYIERKLQWQAVYMSLKILPAKVVMKHLDGRSRQECFGASLPVESAIYLQTILLLSFAHHLGVFWIFNIFMSIFAYFRSILK